jgi:hypothetical protein
MHSLIGIILLGSIMTAAVLIVLVLSGIMHIGGGIHRPKWRRRGKASGVKVCKDLGISFPLTHYGKRIAQVCAHPRCTAKRYIVIMNAR